jgi:uncharacterized membrane protein YdjX (TVP38/TMEM64 family)
LQQQQQLSSAPSLSRSRRSFVVAEQGLDIGRRSKDWLDGVGEFMSAFKIPKLEEDKMAEAVALNSALDETAKLDSLESQLGRMASLANLTLSYYKAAGSRIANAPAVQSRMDGVFVAVNGVIVLLVLRLFLPRLLAIQTMQDLYDFAPELGLPSRAELLSYVDYAQSMDYATKLVLFLLVIIVEKLTLVGEFLPVGIVLPAISPLLFGGVLEGTVISAACAAIGSSANFLVAQKFLRERALKLELFGQPPVGQAKWFTALSRNIEKDGFRAALLLRLAPVLPIPIDAHWYVCGLTPLKLTEFLPAYFLGALKATFLDAYLGSMLVGAALETDELAASSKGVLVAETLTIVTISVLVSQFATQIFSEMMSEEGFERESGSSAGGPDGRAVAAADIGNAPDPPPLP